MRFGFWLAAGLVAGFAAVVDVLLLLAWAYHRGGDIGFNWWVPAVVNVVLIASAVWFAAGWQREVPALRRSDVVDE